MSEKQFIQINPKYSGDKHIKEFVEGLHDSFFKCGKVVYNKRNILKIMQTGSDLMPVVAVKRFKPLGALRGIYYTYIGKSKAERCFEYALELARRGIDTPEALACVTVRKNGVLRDSYYICKCVELPAIKDGVHWEDSFNERMAEDFAAMAAAMHESGVTHGDLNCDNVLYRQNDDGSYSFTLIDINRMTIDKDHQPVKDAAAIADMCCFTRSLKVMRSVAEYYVRARGWDSRMVEKMVDAKRRFNRRRAIKKRIVHPTRKY